MSIETDQLQRATELGKAAFAAGRMAVPANDPALMAMFRGRPVGETPVGEASTVALLMTWLKAWHAANAAAPVFEAGDVVSSYSRAQALADGALINATELAREAGFKAPMALTEAVWLDCVEWTDDDNRRKGTAQDQAGRLWDVLWMASCAARRAPAATRSDYEVFRVPREGKGHKPRPVRLVLRIGAGDLAEPVFTITTPNED